VFENRVLRRIFGPKREEVAGGWRRLHNGEFHSLHTSPNIIRAINSRRMRWAGHAERMGGMRNDTKFWSEILKGRDHSPDLGVDRSKIRMDLRVMEWEVLDWIHFTQDRDQRWARYHGNEPSDSIKGREVLD
jgi:hypothetical protein